MELDWSVAELGTSAEVDSLRTVILRVSCVSAARVNAGLSSEKPVVFDGALRAGHMVCSRILWKDSHACTVLGFEVAAAMSAFFHREPYGLTKLWAALPLGHSARDLVQMASAAASNAEWYAQRAALSLSLPGSELFAGRPRHAKERDVRQDSLGIGASSDGQLAWPGRSMRGRHVGARRPEACSARRDSLC